MMEEIKASIHDQANLAKRNKTKRKKTDLLSILKRKYVQKSKDNFVEQIHNENVISRINSLLRENENVIKSLENIPSLEETLNLKNEYIQKQSKSNRIYKQKTIKKL